MQGTHPEFSVVPVKQNEIELLLDMVKNYFGLEHIEFRRESSRTSLLKLLSDPTLGRALFFKAGSGVIGYGILAFSFDHEFGGRVAFVTDFYFDGPWRGQGLGSRALKEIEKICESLDVLAIELHTLKDNEAARRFYAKNGFEVFDRIPMGKRLRKRSGAPASGLE